MSSDLSKNNVGKGAAYLFIENVAVMLSGYLFWLAISKFASPQMIGISATIVSFAIIITTVVNMGVPISIQRFLGRALGTGETGDIQPYITSSVLVLAVSIGMCSTVIIIAEISFPEIIRININLDSTLTILTLALIATTSIGRLFRGIIIASIDTKVLTVAAIYSAVVKFAVAFLLLFLGFGVLGLVSATVSFAILESIIMGLGVKKILGRTNKGVSTVSIRSSARALLRGGIPNWLPNLVTAAGSQLGTILIFGSHGASQAGFYFIAFSIYTGIETVMRVLFSITYPVLSSLEKGREKLSYRTIKMSLLSTIPLSYSLVFFSDHIMNIFGHLYVNGSPALQVLLLSMMPVALASGMSNFFYASGNYRSTLIIGLASSIPRTVLYFVLVPFFGGIGAALSFTSGSIAGLVLSIVFSKEVNIPISWKEIFVICILPLGTSYLLSILQLNYIVSILFSIAISYIVYIRMNVMVRSDIHDVLQILPRGISSPMISAIDFIAKKIARSY